MDRRSFITKITTGLVGIATVSKLPINWFPEKFQPELIHKKMVKAWNNFCKGHGANQMPVEMLAGPELFTTFEMQTPIIQRWELVNPPNDGYPRMVFKSGTLRNTLNHDRPWEFVLTNRDKTRTTTIEDIRYV